MSELSGEAWWPLPWQPEDETYYPCADIKINSRPYCVVHINDESREERYAIFIGSKIDNRDSGKNLVAKCGDLLEVRCFLIELARSDTHGRQ